MALERHRERQEEANLKDRVENDDDSAERKNRPPYNFWREDAACRVAMAGVAACVLDVLVNAAAAWGARARSRWLLFPWIVFRGLVALALVAVACTVVVKVIVGGEDKENGILAAFEEDPDDSHNNPRRIALAVTTATLLALLIYLWLVVLSLFYELSWEEAASEGRLVRVAETPGGRLTELPPAYTEKPAEYRNNRINNVYPLYGSQLREEDGTVVVDVMWIWCPDPIRLVQ